MKKIIIIIVVTMFLTGCDKINSLEEIFIAPENKYKDILENMDTNNSVVSLYTIYGTHFNIKGSIDVLNDINSVEIVLKNKDHEICYNTFYEISDKLYYQTNEKINEGIDLENIGIGNYLIILKVTTNNEVLYFNLINNTSYHDMKYYTITRNNKNYAIDIMNNEYKEYKFMCLEVKEVILPNNIYDIVIDPGHGNNTGAVSGRLHEDTFNLDYAIELKTILEEELGLKVILTRSDDSYPNEYGANSRTGLPYETKAKMMFSIHLNAGASKAKGLELYGAYNINTKFMESMARSIIENTSSTYSKNSEWRIMDGVYIRTFSESDLKELGNLAKKEKWTYYENANTNTTYYYFIRETGGIITNALVDGRNRAYNSNIYMNYNYGVEAYLLELGYLTNSSNVKILINEKEGYIKGIVAAIKNYIYKNYNS